MLTLSMPELSAFGASAAVAFGASGAAAFSASGFDGAEHAASKLAHITTATQAFIGSPLGKATADADASSRRAARIGHKYRLRRTEAPGWRAPAVSSGSITSGSGRGTALRSRA